MPEKSLRLDSLLRREWQCPFCGSMLIDNSHPIWYLIFQAWHNLSDRICKDCGIAESRFYTKKGAGDAEKG